MAWPFPARQRVEALERQIAALGSSLDETRARLDGLSADLHRLSSGVDAIGSRLDEEAARRRDDADRLEALAGSIAELQLESGTAAVLATQLAADRAADRDTLERHRALLAHLENHAGERHRFLDQVRADLTRIEQQTAADLSELRATAVALAREMVAAKKARRHSAP